MGGYASGNRFKREIRKTTTDETLELKMSRLSERNFLNKGNALDMTWGSVFLVRITVIDEHRLELRHKTAIGKLCEQCEAHYEVMLDATPCHYGGKRWWFLCSGFDCKKRVGILYFNESRSRFLCRTCCNLAYTSQLKTHPYRMLLKSIKYSRKLGYTGDYNKLTFIKPKHMHRKTFNHYQYLANVYNYKSLMALPMVQHCQKAGMLPPPFM